MQWWCVQPAQALLTWRRRSEHQGCWTTYSHCVHQLQKTELRCLRAHCSPRLSCLTTVPWRQVIPAASISKAFTMMSASGLQFSKASPIFQLCLLIQ